jgi:hypothetical protein
MQDCTCKHFASNSNCPTCNRTLKESDFRELVVANPPTPDQAKQAAYRRIFVKNSSESKCLHMKDMWDKIQQQSQMYREGTKFALRQFLKENIYQVRRSMHIQQTLQAMKGEQTNLKQEINKGRETEEGYKQQLLAARQKIGEKDRQLAQFRKMVNSRTSSSQLQSQTPSSSSSRSVGGSRSHIGVVAKPRRVSDQGMAGDPQGPLYPPSQQQPQRPSTPMPYQQHGGSSSQQQAHPTQNNQRAGGSAGGHTRSRNPYEQQLGGGGIVIPPPSKPYGSGAVSQPMMPSRNPYQQTMGSYRSSSAPGSQQQQQQQQQQAMNRSYNPSDRIPVSSQSYAAGGSGGVGSSGGSVTSRSTTSSGGGRIRNITATSNYFFSGGTTAATANAGGPGRKRALSPSNAYAANKSSGSSYNTQVPRGPSNYHQQRQRQHQQSRHPGQGYHR